LHENGFGEIHLACDGLHRVGRKTVTVSYNREGIALEAIGSENVQSVKAAFHNFYAGPEGSG
jgi:hypothetical protein